MPQWLAEPLPDETKLGSHDPTKKRHPPSLLSATSSRFVIYRTGIFLDEKESERPWAINDSGIENTSWSERDAQLGSEAMSVIDAGSVSSAIALNAAWLGNNQWAVSGAWSNDRRAMSGRPIVEQHPAVRRRGRGLGQ